MFPLALSLIPVTSLPGTTVTSRLMFDLPAGWVSSSCQTNVELAITACGKAVEELSAPLIGTPRTAPYKHFRVFFFEA